jgi:hypothetical protein
MSDTFKYKITHYDNERQTLTVELADGGWANITIAQPYPKNLQDVDKIVRAYSIPKEIIEARTGTGKEELDWLNNAVGVEREAERFSFFRAQNKHKTQELESLVGDTLPVDPLADIMARLEALEAKAKSRTKKSE